MKNPVAVVLLIVSVAPAIAENELPRYDVDAYCKKIAGFGGSYSALTEKGCFDLEQDSYNSLKAEWSNLPDTVREHCREIAQYNGGDYMTLRGCVDLEIDAMKSNSSSGFKY